METETRKEVKEMSKTQCLKEDKDPKPLSVFTSRDSNLRREGS